jgi:integral membrane protein (TIGR01906 family)
MARMAAVRSVPVSAAAGTREHAGAWVRLIVGLATGIAILALAILPLLTPFFIHPALDAADSAAWLGVDPATAHALSDRTVSELVFGPGTFQLVGPDGAAFFTPDEQAHMRDARTLLSLFLALGALCTLVVGLYLARLRGPARARARRAALAAVARGAVWLAMAILALSVLGAVAFEPAFELFHRIFFPGGNWAFDPSTSHLVQLYPQAFWELAAGAFGGLALLLAAVTWAFGRSRSRASGPAPEGGA